MFIFLVKDLKGDGYTHLQIKVITKLGCFNNLITCDYKTMMDSYINNYYSLYYQSEIKWV